MDYLKLNKTVLSTLCGLLAVFFFVGSVPPDLEAQVKKGRISRSQVPQKFVLSKEDDELLEDLERRSFLYFWEQSNQKTGLTLDRSRSDGSSLPATHNSHNVASSAATGFALTGLCIAAERKWITREQARERARITLDYFANRAFHKNGWFYHWVDRTTGERRWNSEVSSIDTALLLGGALTARQCFSNDKEIVSLATKIYERVDFAWMLNGDAFLLSHGWRPESGFIRHRWKDYSESSILYLLAIGSPTHAISWKSWYAWKREWVEYKGYRYLAAVGPLFIHQYSQAWFDFRNKRERYKGFSVNYFDNSVNATRAHRQFCIDLSKEFPGYSENIWGISASDSEDGYLAWGGPPRDMGIDGTVVPYAPAGSLMFTPDISVPAVRELKARFGKRIYGRYGFTDAFNPNTDWTDSDVIGIDLGITLVGAENLRSGNVWKWFMRNPEAGRAMHRALLR